MMPDAGPARDTRTPIRILLLEDSDFDAELVTDVASRTGLPCTVRRVMTRDSFEAAIREDAVDLILADYVLPAFDGIAALQIAQRHCPQIPFVFVSGTLGEDVAVEALKSGATDYVTKQRLDRLPRTILRALAEARARSERDAAERALRQLNETLEARVAQRTQELLETNAELRRQVAERERAEAALRQAQRLEAVGQLTSGVAHDFNNLLTVISGNIAFLERQVTDASAKRRLGMMLMAAERGAKLTTQLLAFSRRQRLEPKPLDLNRTVASMQDLLQSSLGGSTRIAAELQPDLWPAMVDPSQIELAVLNLAINARDAMQPGGTLTVETANVVLGAPRRATQPPAGEYVMVAVRDTGTGIPADILDRVFEPFFTTKDVGKGSGLGLAQVYGFAKQSGGGVDIETELGRGTVVRVYLPRATRLPDREEPVRADPDGAASTRPDRPVVLVVDDDGAVRDITTTMLSERGYRVREAESRPAALAILQSPECDGVDLLIVDFAMPGMNGAEVAREARRLKPKLPILFVTGYAGATALKQLDSATEERIVHKPFRSDDLARKVAAALGGGPGSPDHRS